MSIVFFETISSMESKYSNGEVFYTFEKGLYDIWMIGRGGNGGQVSDNWALYRGAGGTSGSGGGVVRVIIYNPIPKNTADSSATIRFSSLGDTNFDCSCEIWGIKFNGPLQYNGWARFGVKHGLNGNRAQDAGAFRPTPSKADPPSGGTGYFHPGIFSSSENQKNTIYYTATGPNGSNSGDRTDGSPALGYDVSTLGPDGGKYLTPSYIAGAAQNGYSDTDASDGTLCLGQPGGGQGIDNSDIGYGGEGGIIIEKINKSVACDIYRGTELLNGLYLGSNGITPYVYI